MQTSILRGAYYAPQLKFAQKLYKNVTLQTLCQELIPAGRRSSSFKQPRENQVGIVFRTIRTQAVRKVNPTQDDDPIYRIKAKEQPILPAKLRPAPIPILSAEGVSQQISAIGWILWDEIEGQPVKGRESFGLFSAPIFLRIPAPELDHLVVPARILVFEVGMSQHQPAVVLAKFQALVSESNHSSISTPPISSSKPSGRTKGESLPGCRIKSRSRKLR